MTEGVNKMTQKNNRIEKPKKNVSRLNLVILSFVASIILWIIVVQTVNPNISHIITDVPVNIVGEGTLRDRGIVVMNEDEIGRFSVKISGKRNDVIRAIDRVRVNFDVSQVTQLGEFELTPTVYVPQSINVEQQNLGQVMIRFEECTSKEVPVVTKHTGLSRNKVAEIIPSVESVVVSGAASEISALSKCVINVDASDIDKESTGYYSFIFADDNEKELSENKTLFCNISEIETAVKVYDKVEFQYEVVLSETMQDKYKIDIDTESLPFETIYGGLRTQIDEIPKIKYIIPSDDYENGRMEFEATVESNDDVFVSEKTIHVYGNITKLKTKKVRFNIIAINKADNIEATFTQSVTKDIVMPEDENITELVGYIDLMDKGVGEHTLDITFENSDIYAKNPEIQVTIKSIGG